MEKEWYERLGEPPPVPYGTRIELVAMPNDPSPISPGSRGTVVRPSNGMQLSVIWDNGRSLSVLPGVDEFTVIDDLEELLGLTRKEP